MAISARSNQQRRITGARLDRVDSPAYKKVCMSAHDFSLPSDSGRPFVFDAALRARQRTLLFFYRGHW
jgi:hypothetical protein